MLKLPYQDYEKIGGELRDLYQEDQRLKKGLIEVWRQNIDFLNGKQTLEWDPQTRRYRFIYGLQKRTSVKDYIYSTNEIEPVVRTLVSFLTRNKPKAHVYPSDPCNGESTRRAKIAKLVLDSKWDIDKENLNYQMAAWWALTTGTVFRKDYWDPSLRGIKTIAGQNQFQDQSLYQRITSKLFSKPVESLEKDKAENSQYPPSPERWGDSAVVNRTPFHMAVDFNAKDSNYKWIRESYLQPVEWVKANYSRKSDEFYSGLIDQVQAQDNFGDALEIDLEFRFQTPSDQGARPKILGDMCVCSEFYTEPDPSMPWNKDTDDVRGRLIFTAADIPLYDGPSPYNWHPYTKFGYEPYLGRFWDKSLVEQLISLQVRLNELNGSVLENAKKMAKGLWLIPEGTLKEGKLKGKEGHIVYWKPNAAYPGVGPQRQPGIPLPQQFFAEIQKCIDQIVRISGSNAVLQGSAPAGINAAAALQLLLENAQSQHGPLINNFDDFVAESQTKKIQNFQKFCKEPRDDLVKYLKKIKYDLSQLDVDSIYGDMIEDNVNVVVESGSSIPKSQAARQNQLMQFAQMGVLGDVVKDPITKQQFLSEFGITEYDKTNHSEWEKIQWETERIEKGLEPSPSPYDIDELHIPHHKALAQRPYFIENARPEIKAKLDEHIKWHQDRMAQAAEANQESQKKQFLDQAEVSVQAENQKNTVKEQAKSQGKKEEMILKYNLENSFSNPEENYVSAEDYLKNLDSNQFPQEVNQEAGFQ